MKFKEEVCGNCGLDLTTAEPIRVREMPAPGGDGIEMVFLAECPQCHTNRIVVAPELAISPDPEPEPVARGRHRRASEPEAPPEEPGAEEKPSEKSEPEE